MNIQFLLANILLVLFGIFLVQLYSVRASARNKDRQPDIEWSHTLCEGKRVTYEKAKEAIAALGPGWRFPEVTELYPLVDHTRFNPAINTELHSDMKASPYWTGTPAAWDTNSDAASRAVWVVSFSYGGSSDYLRDDLACVRAVRSVSSGQLL